MVWYDHHGRRFQRGPHGGVGRCISSIYWPVHPVHPCGANPTHNHEYTRARAYTPRNFGWACVFSSHQSANEPSPPTRTSSVSSLLRKFHFKRVRRPNDTHRALHSYTYFMTRILERCPTHHTPPLPAVSAEPPLRSPPRARRPSWDGTRTTPTRPSSSPRTARRSRPRSRSTQVHIYCMQAEARHDVGVLLL